MDLAPPTRVRDAPPLHPLDVHVLVERTEALLRAGIPLTLLLDLGLPDGPRSRHLYVQEPGDAGWLTAS